jgi:antitoxin (DNA-binding transcriptional repressor) of toxin-antitoxin stability system
MSQEIGIEAARARLGDLADQASTTGQITHLTRHGKTVAVIGPVGAVQPRAGIKLLLHFPHEDWEIETHSIPRKGERFEWTSEDGIDGFWTVSDVIWAASKDGLMSVGVDLDPLDVHTEELMHQQEAARIAHAKEGRAAEASDDHHAEK